jgi:hypothetical protein
MKEKNFCNASRPLNIKAVYFFKMSGTNYPVTWHYIPEDGVLKHATMKT